MDILTQAVDDTATLHLKNAKGEFLYEGDKPVQVTVYGPGSTAFAAVEARQSQRALKRMQDNDGKISMASREQRAGEEAEDLAAITVGFENLTLGETKGADLALAVYSNKKLGFIGKQVGKFVADWGNFSAASIAA